MSITAKVPRFAGLPITAKLMLVVALPVAMMCISFGAGLLSDWRQSENAASIAAIARIAPAFTQAAHEMQKERGASALMLGAKGALFRAELQQQRAASDAALAQLQGAFRALRAVHGAPPVTAAEEEVEAALSRVKAIRPQIDGLAVPAGEMAAQYTSAIARMIGMLQSIARIEAPSRIGDDAKALLAIAEAKERAGLERALAANGFAAGRFEPENFRRLVSLAAEQAMFIDDVRGSARQELVEKLNAALSSEQARAVDTMRQAAFGAPFGADIRQISPPDWFGKATARIDLLKSVEGAAEAALVSDAEAVSAAATSSFRRSLAMALGALIASMLAAFAVARSITRPMAALVDDTLGLARGDHDRVIAGVQRRDEIGEIASALLVFQENAARVRALEEQERAASAARLARAQSMEAVVSDVGDVVTAAAAGDFSARLQIEDADEQMQKLVAGINEINAVVDSATTEFAGALQAIAGGDLTSRVETAYRGRFADLKAAINETVDRLSETVATIQVTAADVGLAAREINMGTDDLSKRTEEQASSLEETAATTEELAASVKASAQGSKDAARIADEAMRAAQNGGAIAGQAVEAMARIESASQKISDIIRVIDDIAFQTNLLALNAAVEAARAGDAGKGFAVVASEVRTLAQRSSDAAKDISGLISSSNGEVEEGVKLVRQAGEQLSQILDASQKVASTIAEISAASGEQANGIDEMSQAVAHLDEMTQQNAALAEESAASAGALSGRIGQLNDLVAQFRTGREAQGQQAYAAPAYAAAGGGSARSMPRPAPRPAAPARLAPRPVAAQARPAGHAMHEGGGEPERLRQLAQAAFAQTATSTAPRKVANGGSSRANDAGWEEF